MHDLIAKIARLAVSKAAAFFYAVAVGVAGNIAFNFVQEHRTPPVTAPVAVIAPAAATAPQETHSATVPTASAAFTPPPHVASTRQADPKPIATAPILPNPSAIALPRPSALPAPPLQPTALPASKPAPAPSEAAVKPAPTAGFPPASPAPPAAATAALGTPSPAPLPPGPAATASLPPIGAAIDVVPPPIPPAAAMQFPTAPPPAAIDENAPPAPPAPATASSGTPAAKPPGTLELSDIWHPTRAVEKGLHWAGGQLPFGGDAADPPPRAQVPSGPISLLPSAMIDPAAKPAGKAAPTQPGRPGPGSGGLY